MKNSDKKEDSKSRILKEATKLFAHKGFDAVSTREICKAANVNLCMISYYFGGKKELYDSILKELVKKQTEYAESFMDLSIDPQTLSKKEQVELLKTMTSKFIDFFYSNITNEIILFLLKEQQKPDFNIQSETLNYLRKVVACVLDKDVNDKTVIFKTLFIISQINSPKIMPTFSLRLLGQDDFTQEDIAIIKENMKNYINLLLKESEID